MNRKASVPGGGMATRLCVAMLLRASGLMATQQRVAMPPVTGVTMNRLLAMAGVLILAAAGAGYAAGDIQVESAAGKVTVTRGPLAIVFDPAGRGFVASARLGEVEVGTASPASGLFASLIRPEGAAPPLAPIGGKEIVGEPKVARVVGKKAEGRAEVEIAGTVAFAGVGEAPLSVKIVIPERGPAMGVSVEMRVPDQARGDYLASFGLALPLGLTFHPTSDAKSKVDRNTVAVAILPRAGTSVPEVRWLAAAQDQASVWGPMLWTLAGVRQATPCWSQVWEAWSTQNPPFILQHNTVHPGWMAVADGRVAVAAGMAGIEKIAPKEIYVDSQAKVLRICFQSPYGRPLDLASAPATLSAGPAYVFVEAAQPNTRSAEDYGDAKNRPALAAIGAVLAALPPTQCNFGALRTVEAAARKDPPLVPADPEFTSHDPAPPDEIAIYVDEPQGVGFDAWPVTRGIPLARGVLKDEKQAALVDAQGKAVPCVSRAVAFWPDGSIKWLLLDFQTRLEAGNGAKLRLVVGEKARPAPVPNPLKVAETPEGLSVETGKLRMAFANPGGRLALGVALDLNGDGKVTDGETVIKPGGAVFGCTFSHIKDTERYVSQTWLDPGELDTGAVEVTALKVEEQSPLRAVVLVRANLRHRLLASTIDRKQRPPAGTPVTLRFHLYAGSSMVRLTHTFMFAGDVRFDFLRELGIRLPLAVEAGQKVRTSLDGREAEMPRDGEGGLLQEGADSALAWRAAARGDMTPSPGEARPDKPAVAHAEAVARGREADGWLDVSSGRWGVTVGLRGMRERFPQEIHVDGEGIWTHFYPPHAAPMDVRRYAFKYGDGESTSTGFGSAFGALRTHEAYWFFHPGAEKAARGSSYVKEMLEPPLARVCPRHVADTLAVGHVAEHGAATRDRHFDNVLYHLPRMHRHNRDFWRWFGFWDFGDEVQVYNAARQRWDVDDGRYGWYNNEPVRDYNYHLAWLMTGNRRLWETAEAMSYHVYEVDVRHASPQPFMSAGATLAKQAYDHSTTSGIDLCGRRHNCQHWADGYFGPRVGSPPGFRLCYYQNGDPVMREYLERLLAAAMKTRRSQYMGADGDEAILWAMLMGYEMTRDPKYLDRIKGYMGVQVEFAKKNNGFPAAQANWDWATNTPGAPPADPRDDLWIWSFGGHLAMIEAADLFDDPAVQAMLRDWVLALEGVGPDAKRREAWSNQIGACPLLAWYYRTTGDTQALGWLKYRAGKFHSGIPNEAPAADLPASEMERVLPAYTPNDGYGWVYTTTTFWYVGIPAWQGALRARAGE